MKKAFPQLLVCIPLVAIAQTTFTTEFPSEAVDLSAQALKEIVLGKALTMQPATGPAIRVQYQEPYAFLNMGNFTDTGKWRVEGSVICIEWKKIGPNCAAVKVVGDKIYTKRSSNGEVLLTTVQ